MAFLCFHFLNLLSLDSSHTTIQEKVHQCFGLSFACAPHSYLFVVLSRDYFPGDGAQILVVTLLPVAMFGLFVVFKIISKCHGRLQLYKYCCKWCKQLFKYTKICDQNNSSCKTSSQSCSFLSLRKNWNFLLTMLVGNL